MSETHADTPSVPARPGARLVTLDEDVLSALWDHPAQRTNLRTVTQLVADLRDCTSAEDFYEFQRQLFSKAHALDNRRAESIKVAKRLRGRRGVPAGSQPPHVGAMSDPSAWHGEALVYERLFRQVRAVGDALAWRVFRYDRAIIAALSSNQSPGPLVKRTGHLEDDTTGLSDELRRIDEIWKERRNFAVHHDLTNCLRIGDVTEVESPGQYLLHEVKRNPQNRSSKQRLRMQTAVRSIESDGPLPGTGRRVMELETIYRTDLQALIDLVLLARQQGSKGAKLEHGRALVVTSLGDLSRVTRGNLDDGRARFDAARRSAIRRAGIGNDTHHLRGLSADLAARVPLMPPWAIYPLQADECAALICDAIVFEVLISTEVLTRLLEEQGLAVENMLPAGNHDLDPTAGVFRLRNRSRQLDVYPNSIHPMLHELLHPETWAIGTSEMMRRPILAPDVMQRYHGDSAAWFPQPKD